MAVGVALALLFEAASAPGEPASGDEAPCVVRLMPPDATADWRRAAAELRQRVRHWPAPDRDCRELQIDVANGGALLTITTKDGRQARRTVAAPSALVPAASALAVGVDSRGTPPAPTGTRIADDGAAHMNLPDPTSEARGLLFAAGGVRLAGPGAFWAPVLRGGAALDVKGWELGAFVDWAPRYGLATGEVPPRFAMWSLASGLTAGRREPLGNFDLLAGLMFGANFVHQQSTTEEIDDDMVEIDVEEGAGVDLQLGAYVGLATPRDKNIRFRTQIEMALPLSHPGETRALDADLPPLPGWSLTGVIGAEFGVP
jgi:hypothetical protein